MTCREKLTMEHPEHLDAKGWGGVDTCPTVFSYAKKPPYCSDETMTNNERCTKCWDREIPEKKEEPAYNPVEKAYQLLIDYYHNGKTTNFDQVIRYLGEAMERASNAKVATAYQQLVNFLYLRVSIDFNEVIRYLGEVLDDHPEEGEPVQFEYRSSEPIGKVKDIHEENGGITAVVEPTIKDSGDRTQFESGAVRDMHTGKGRMDLLPWAAVMEVSKHCENGAAKYGEHNVDKGIPTSSLCDSAARHLAKYLDGWTDEPHLVAAAWNLLWAIQMEIKRPELVNTPWRGGPGADK